MISCLLNTFMSIFCLVSAFLECVFLEDKFIRFRHECLLYQASYLTAQRHKPHTESSFAREVTICLSILAHGPHGTGRRSARHCLCLWVPSPRCASLSVYTLLSCASIPSSYTTTVTYMPWHTHSFRSTSRVHWTEDEVHEIRDYDFSTTDQLTLRHSTKHIVYTQ